jgi:hypothetical protein
LWYKQYRIKICQFRVSGNTRIQLIFKILDIGKKIHYRQTLKRRYNTEKCRKCSTDIIKIQIRRTAEIMIVRPKRVWLKGKLYTKLFILGKLKDFND